MTEKTNEEFHRHVELVWVTRHGLCGTTLHVALSDSGLGSNQRKVGQSSGIAGIGCTV